MRRVWEVCLSLLGVALAIWLSESLPHSSLQRDSAAAVVGLCLALIGVILYESRREEPEPISSANVWQSFYRPATVAPTQGVFAQPKATLKMADDLIADTATRHHAVYFRLRFWNVGEGGITPEVRVTRVLVGEAGVEPPISAQLPLVLGWSSLSVPPVLTKHHTAGETVGVLAALNWRPITEDTGMPISPPLIYVPGANHHATIGQVDEKVYVCVQAIVPEIETIERWFWAQLVKEGEGIRCQWGPTTGPPDAKP